MKVKKKQAKIICLLISFHSFFFVFFTSSHAATLWIKQKLTTHTADDFQPAVSPDGKKAAFVSNRSGNNDIWIIPIDGGPARQLTTHTASDMDPAWSRDGKKLAFTSLRNDVKGDIWILDIETGKERRITDSKASESHPSWFPDGKKIAFSRDNEVWSIELQNGKEERIFKGLSPSLSPDGRFIAYVSSIKDPDSRERLWVYNVTDGKSFRLTSGEFFDAFPSWAPDGKEIYFSRFSEDTNGDGLIDVKDNPSIWKIKFSESIFNDPARIPFAYQLTAGSSYELFPSVTDDSVIFTASHGKDLDIYKLPRDGEVPKLKSAREQLDLAYRQKEPLHKLLSFRKVYLSDFPEDDGLFSEAKYQVALTYLAIGHERDAVRELESLVSSFPKGRRYLSLAKIELSRINAGNAVSAGNRDGALKELAALKDISDRYKDQPYSQSMAQVEVGNIYLSLKDEVQALREYERVRELYPDEVDAVALARLKMADIYSYYGDEVRLIGTYVSIIKDYPKASLWGVTASQKVLSIIDTIEDEKEHLSRYRDLAVKYGELPYLPALAQYKIGEFYHIRGRYEEALLEYKKTIDNFPTESAVVDEAAFGMAEIELSKRAYNNALTIYDGLMKKGNTHAKTLYIKASLEKAGSELLGKEPAQAIKSYRAVIDIDYNEVRAHRGFIEAYAVKREPEKAVAIYGEDVKKFPDSDTANYALGLAYTYLEPPAFDAAESQVKKAISINYSLPFAHQTLGWIYEVKEKLGKEKTLAMAADEYEVALALLGPDRKKEASDLLLNIGNGYSALGDNERAYEFYKRRLETGVGFEDRKREAIFYESLGNAASRIGNYKEAVPYYIKALNHAMIAKERDWELKITEELGLLFQETREYAKAADYFLKALKTAEEEKMVNKKALLLRNIAYNNYHEGKVEEAIWYFNRSLDTLSAEAGRSVDTGGLLTIKKALSLGKEGSEAFMGFDKPGEEKLIYSYLGRAYSDTGEYESALNELLKKLDLIPKEGRNAERGIVLNNIGSIYYQIGDGARSYQYFRESLEVSGKAKNLTGEMINIINIGLLAAELQMEASGERQEVKIEEAIKLQEKGISLIESEKRGREYLPYLKNNLGLLYLKATGERQQERGDIKAIVTGSISLLRKDRERLLKAAEQFKEAISALPKKKEPWLTAVLELNLATSLYRLGEDKEASGHLALSMKVAEEKSLADLKWRSLMLLAELDGGNRVKHLEDAVTSFEGQAIPTIDRHAEHLYKELITLLFSDGKIDDAFVYAERAAIKKVKEEAAKARYPLPKEETPMSAKDVQWFLDEKTAVVRYLLADKGLLVWFIDSDNVQGRMVRVSPEDLKDAIDDFLSSIDKKEVTDRLSAHLIRPVADLLAGKKRLYIVPDGLLSSIPFAALKIGKEFMVDRFEVAYLPSGAILNAAYEKRNLNKVNILISQGNEYSEGYVEGIGSKTPIFAASKSDKAKFLDMASNYGMLHITDRFSVNRTTPFRSSLQFGNGSLFFSELMPLKLNPNLIVLTNPQTTLTLHPHPEGKGKVESLEPLALGLQPLIFAGSPSVVVKTIPSDKWSEEIFMKVFYDALRKESAAGALAKAQRALKSQGMGPKIWAGYSLYGYSGMNQEEERKYASQRVADIMNAAIEAYSKGDWKGSMKKFEEGLLFLKTIGAKENLGSIYQALAKAGANSGDYAKGASYQEEFIKTGGGKLSKPELADAYKTLGILHSRAGEDKKAEGPLIEALKLWKESGNKKSLSEGYRTLALFQEKGGSYSESLSSFSAALNIDRELRDTASAGQDLWDIGRLHYLRLSRLDEGMKAYREALSIFKGLGNKGKTAGILLDIGLVYEQEGEYEAAKNSYLEGIRVAKEINDKTSYSRGTLYMANVAWHTGDYQEAFRYQKIAVGAAVELKDRKQEAMAHNLAGLIYMNLGMLEKALDSLSISLSISIKTGERLDAAAAHNNIGIVRRELGNLEKSVESFKSALAIDTEIKSRWGMAYDMRNLGISFERLERSREALENLKTSLTLSRDIGERKNEAMALYSLGMLSMNMGKDEEASGTLKEAYRIGKDMNLLEVLWRSLRAQATIHIRKNRPMEAYQAMKEAIDIVEKMRGRIKVDEYKSGFLENKADLYEEMVMLLLGMGKVEEAFNYAERARSRNFIDMLGNQKMNLKSTTSQRLLDKERTLRVRIDTLEERVRREISKTSLMEELKKARKDYEALLVEIKEESPELASFVTVAPPSLSDIQRAVPDNAALLEYMVTKNGIVIWVVRGSGIESIFVPVDRPVVKEKIVRYRELMEQVSPLERESLDLYNLLIRPVEGHIAGIKYVGVIPHDILHYLSFSSLYDGRSYLIESHSLFYSPSASVLKIVMERRLGAYGNMPLKKFLVIGNPDLGDSAYDLPFAEREAGSIIMGFEGSEILLRKEATETRVKADIGKFNGIHFASHGVYDSATPLFSTLKLTKDEENDGNLTANEVFSINIRASLVMMSACQTGLGKVTTGDEIIGLNRAFLYAGASSIISTLWRVNDAASAILVKRFYRNYKERDIAESLRLAQLAVRVYYPHPAYWAGFGLTGDFR